MNDTWQSEIDPSRTAFFLDVDGTLVGFKERPEDVVADRFLVALLKRVSEAADGALALVSGRMISDLDRIASPLVLPAAGVHGAELRFADGRRENADAIALLDARPGIQAFAEKHAGLRLEEKGTAIAIHYRQAPQWEAEVAAFASRLTADRALDAQHGKFVVEIKASRNHKGDAIGRFMETKPFAGRYPLFIGDDLTDEHGFRSVNELSGITIKVGRPADKSVASYRLANPPAVHRFLELVSR